MSDMTMPEDGRFGPPAAAPAARPGQGTMVEQARAIAEALPAAARVRMEIIAGAGHLPCVERPAATTHALSDFLASLADSV